MGTTIMLFAVGLAGSFVFDRFHLPGGAMTGAMIAVVIFKSCGSITSPDMAHWVRFIVYGCVGVLVGNMRARVCGRWRTKCCKGPRPSSGRFRLAGPAF